MNSMIDPLTSEKQWMNIRDLVLDVNVDLWIKHQFWMSIKKGTMYSPSLTKAITRI